MIKKILIIVAILLISAVCLSVFVACEAKEWGKFYSLQEAYDQGLLSVEDLEQIAEYQNIWKTDDRKAEGRPKVEDLDKKIAKEIKESYVFILQQQGDNTIKASDVIFREYFGTYNDSVIIMIEAIHTCALRDVEVGGVMFHYLDGLDLQVWVKN